MHRLSPVAVAAMLRLSLVVSALSSAMVVVGGTLAWAIEKDQPGSTLQSWTDAIWWALTTLTTVGYGDHVPVTGAGRIVAAGIMIYGVAMLGAVAAVVALFFARTIAAQEEAALEAEAQSLERRLEVRLDGIESQLRRIEQRLDRADRPQRSG